jgi:hypothetical protein
VHQHVCELRFERVRVLTGREIAALFLAGDAQRVRDAPDDLAHARLVPRLRRQTGLAEVLAHHDVGRELRPLRRHLDVVHLEHDRAVGVRDDGASLVPADLVERIEPDLGETSWHSDAAAGRMRCGVAGGNAAFQRVSHP